MFIKLKDPDHFKRVMLMKGFTQRSLAVSAGISDTTINHVINEIRYPGPTTAKKICNTLDCEFEDIFFIEEDSKSYQHSTA